MNYKLKIKIALKKYFPQIVYPILIRKNDYLIHRINLLNHLGIDTIFDIGANIGQYAHLMRYTDFDGKIVSFEPIKKAYKQLEDLSKNIKDWEIRNYGLGNEDTELTINISENLVSSSFLDEMSLLNEIVPETRFIDTEKVVVRKMDSIINEFSDKNSKLFVKIDAQGYESKILEGATNSLSRISAFQLELPLIELYKGEKTFLEMVNYMKTLNYKLVAIEPGWNDPKTGLGVEVDGIFVREK